MPRGNVNVRITSDTSGLTRGTRSAESDLNRLERTSKKSLEGVHHAARLALGVTGLGGLAFGLKDVTGEAIKAQAEQAKLARAVHNAGLSWKENSKAVEEHLSKLSRLSGFQKSDLSASLANSVRTTGDLTKAFHLNGIAMDIARTKGLDLQGAQSLVARAYNGNLRGLKSLGIALDPVTVQQDKLKTATQKLSDELRNSHGANKETIRLAKEKLQTLKDEAVQQDKTATRTKALSVLQQKFGGQSAAYSKTAAGEFDRAKASLTLAEEEIGKALLPSLASAAKSVANIATNFAEHWPQIKKQIGDTVGPIFSFAKGVGEFVSHHEALQKVAITFASIAASYKIISKAGAISGVSGLVTAVRGRGGSGAGAGAAGFNPLTALTAVAVGGAVASQSTFHGFSGKESQLLAGAQGANLKETTRNLAALRQEFVRLGDSSGPFAKDSARMVQAIDDFLNPIKDVQGQIARLRNSSADNWKDISSNVRLNTKAIKSSIGENTTAGRELMSQNFAAAAAAVKNSMQAGVISTKQGTAEIESLMRKALAEFGITGKQAGRYLNNQDTLTGKSLTGAGGKAVGGYIGMAGEMGTDNVPVMLGRGEAVLNRHQQAVVEPALRMAYGMGLPDLFSTVTQPHYLAGGGFAGLKPGIASAARRVLARFPGLGITSTTGGTHAPGSYHYLGEAVDIAGPNMDQAAAWIKSTMGAGLTEGIHNPNLSVKFGKNVPSSYWGASTWAAHANHIHLAVAGALRAAGLSGAQIKRVLARSGLGAVSGIAQGALDTVRRGAQSVLSRAAGSASGGGDLPGTGGASGTYSKSQLKALWVRANGRLGDPNLMAAIALAESSGDPNAANGPYHGLWQVGPGGPFNPLANARAAGQKLRSQGLNAWETWTNGAYRQYLARGGYVGMASGGIGGQINDITGGVHANGPAPKKARKKAAAHKKAAKKPPARSKDINPFTGKVESHTAAQWHDIRLRYRVKRRNASTIQRTGTSSNVPAHGNVPAVINGQVVDLPTFTDTSGDIGDQDFTNVQGAISDVDLHVQAGDITEEQGVAQKRTIINSAVAGGFGTLSPHDILELRATLGGLKDVVEDNTKALLEIKTQQAENTQKLLSASQAQYPQIFAALMDALSGGIGGRAGLGFQSPSYAGGMAAY